MPESKNNEIIFNVRFPVSLWDAIKMRIAGPAVIREFVQGIMGEMNADDSGVEQSGSSVGSYPTCAGSNPASATIKELKKCQ